MATADGTERDSCGNKAALPDHSLTTGYDYAANLPRKASLTDQTICRLYFIAGGGLIKIGISTNLTSRFRAIKNSSPVPLELLASMPGCSVTEGFTHQRFSHLRQHGEWFTDDGSIRALIEQFSKEPARGLTVHAKPKDTPA